MSINNDIQSSEIRCLYWPNRILRFLSSICLYIGMALIVAITLVTVVHVIARYAFGSPIKGQAELCTYMLITGVFLMITATQLVKGHTTIGLIVDRFSERTQIIFDCITYILCLAVSVLVSWQSIVQAKYIMKSSRMTAILHIPQFPLFYVVAVCWALISLVILMQILDYLLKGAKR